MPSCPPKISSEMFHGCKDSYVSATAFYFIAFHISVQFYSIKGNQRGSIPLFIPLHLVGWTIIIHYYIIITAFHVNLNFRDNIIIIGFDNIIHKSYSNFIILKRTAMEYIKFEKMIINIFLNTFFSVVFIISIMYYYLEIYSTKNYIAIHFCLDASVSWNFET